MYKYVFGILFVGWQTFAGDVTWNGEVVSGSWNVAENWTGKVLPGSLDTVYMTNSWTELGHVVTLASTHFSTATNVLVLENQGQGTNVLKITGKLEVARNAGENNYWDIQVNKGGRIELLSGGELVRRDGFYGQYASTDSGKHYFLGLLGGGVFHQTGGVVAITNNSRQGILIGDASGSVTSRYVMTGGKMIWNPDCLGSQSWVIRKTGRLEIGSSAEVDFWTDNAFYRNRSFKMSGGVFDLSGNASFVANVGNSFILGTGVTMIRDNAVFNHIGYQGVVSPSDTEAADAVAYFAVSNHAQCTLMGDNSPVILGMNGKTYVDITTDQPMGLGNSWCYVACWGGYAELNLRGANVVKVGNYSGLHIGADDGTNGDGKYAGDFKRASTTHAAPTGVVNMASGTLIVGGRTGEGWKYRFLMGLTVGDGTWRLATNEDAFESRLYNGTFNLIGGVVTNEGYLTVGAGSAVGRINQTAGSMVTLCNDSAPMVIGVSGGWGEYVLSNGTLEVGINGYSTQNLFIGGATTNQLDRHWANSVCGYPVNSMEGIPNDQKSSNGCYSPTYPLDRHDARGRLVLACADVAKPCSVMVKTDTTLSSDGAGVIEVIGPGTSFSTRDLVVSNQFASCEGADTGFKFVFTQSGVSCLQVRRNLVLASGAKIAVDARKYRGRKGKVKLISCQARQGLFTDVEVKGGNLVQEANDPNVYVELFSGTVLTIR